MRVQACFRRLPVGSVRHNDESRDLQLLSAWSGSLRLIQLDFYSLAPPRRIYHTG
jgi:hypothetical protein